MLQVYCKNTGTSRKYPEGTSLLQMLGDFEFEKPYPIVSAKVNNVSQGLKFKVYKSKDIEFVSIKEYSGRRVYCRSLCFLLCSPPANCTWNTPSLRVTSSICTKRTMFLWIRQSYPCWRPA